MSIVQLENWHYETILGGGGLGRDAWRLTGKVYGHPNFRDGDKIFPSTPANYDSDTRVLTTASGRAYKLGICDGNEETQLADLLKDIETGGTQTW